MVYELLDRWVMATVPYKSSGKVLLTRLDLIGDYLMCRPFFKPLREGSAWKDRDWFFAGNQQVKSLAESLDGQVLNGGIWIDRGRFINSIGYRFSILKQVREQGFEVVLNLSHTRQFWLESLVRVSGARETICSSGTGRYMSAGEKKQSASWYTQIIASPSEATFEFYRNRLFLSSFSSQVAQVNSLQAKPKSNREPGPVRIFLAPGASTSERQWPLSHFKELLNRLSREMKAEFVLIGGPAEVRAGKELADAFPTLSIRNQIGKWSLVESMEQLSHADLLVANESGPVHMAATTGTACVCISNGNHFGRWNPYPSDLAPAIRTVYPPSFEPRDEKYAQLVTLYHERSSLPASEVPVESVFQAARELLASLNSF